MGPPSYLKRIRYDDISISKTLFLRLLEGRTVIHLGIIVNSFFFIRASFYLYTVTQLDKRVNDKKMK